MQTGGTTPTILTPAERPGARRSPNGATTRMLHKGRILVVDDEVNARNALGELLRDDGYTVESAADGFKALGKVADFAPDLVLTDLKMPGMDGIQLLGRIHEQDPDLPVIVMTAFGEVETAVGAMRAGARDYLSKPVNFGELGVVIARELEQRRLRAEAGLLRERLAERYRFDNIIGNAPPMQAIFKTVAQIASSRSSSPSALRAFTSSSTTRIRPLVCMRCDAPLPGRRPSGRAGPVRLNGGDSDVCMSGWSCLQGPNQPGRIRFP